MGCFRKEFLALSVLLCTSALPAAGQTTYRITNPGSLSRRQILVQQQLDPGATIKSFLLTPRNN